MDTIADITEVKLERLRLEIYQRISKELLKDFVISPSVTIEALTDWLSDNITVRVRQEILGQQLDKVTVRYPADWRQAAKKRFAPEWFTRRWPVQYDETMIDVQALYPKIALPHEQDVAVIVRILEHGTAQIEKS